MNTQALADKFRTRLKAWWGPDDKSIDASVAELLTDVEAAGVAAGGAVTPAAAPRAKGERDKAAYTLYMRSYMQNRRATAKLARSAQKGGKA